MGQKKLLGGFRGVKFTFACSFLYLLFSNIIFSILQYINQRKENRARWVGIMQTTTVPGNDKLYLVFNLQCICGEQGHKIMKNAFVIQEKICITCISLIYFLVHFIYGPADPINPPQTLVKYR